MDLEEDTSDHDVNKNKKRFLGSPWSCVTNVLQLSQNPNFQDVTLICSGGNIMANSFLLASLFPFFKKLLKFTDEPFFISLPNVNNDQLNCLLNNLYGQTSEIFVSSALYKLLQQFGCEKHQNEDLDVPFDSTDNLYDSNIYDNSEIPDKSSDSDYEDDSKVKEEEINESKKSAEPRKIRSKQKLKLIPCSFCGQTFTRKHNLNLHMDRVHAQENSISSMVDGVKENDYESKDTDKKPKTKLPCPTCGKIFYRRNTLKLHIEHIHSEANPNLAIEVKEEVCDSNTGESKTKTRFLCPACGKSFSRRRNIKLHYERVHTKTVKNGYYKCPTCKDKMLPSEVEQHKCILYPCDVCGKQFTSLNGAKIHKKDMHEESIHCSCEVCGKAFQNQRSLKNHIVKRHERKEDVPCHICGKEYSWYTIKEHLLSHEEKEVCKICNTKVRRLKEHMDKMHTTDENKMLHCPDCGKGFTSTYHLKKHQMSVHLKLRPYKCRYGCAFAYNDSSNRNAHEKKTHGKLFETSSQTEMK